MAKFSGRKETKGRREREARGRGRERKKRRRRRFGVGLLYCLFVEEHHHVYGERMMRMCGWKVAGKEREGMCVGGEVQQVEETREMIVVPSSTQQRRP